MGEIFRNLKKDALLEFRSPAAVSAAVVFACITTVVVSIVSAGVPLAPSIQSILFWIIVFFSAMNSLLHIFTREENERTAFFLRLKISSESVYISKLIFNILFFCVIESMVCVMFVFFMETYIKNPAMFALSAAGGGFAIVSASTIMSAIAAKAGGKGTLFTVISFPLLLPSLTVSISSTTAAIEGRAQGFGNIFFLFAFSGAIILISYLLFRYVWIEE